jgi:hypothetical protein
LRGLSQELANIRSALAAAGNNAEAVKAQQTKLQSALQAYRALLDAGSEG